MSEIPTFVRDVKARNIESDVNREREILQEIFYSELPKDSEQVLTEHERLGYFKKEKYHLFKEPINTAQEKANEIFETVGKKITEVLDDIAFKAEEEILTEEELYTFRILSIYHLAIIDLFTQENPANLRVTRQEADVIGFKNRFLKFFVRSRGKVNTGGLNNPPRIAMSLKNYGDEGDSIRIDTREDDGNLWLDLDLHFVPNEKVPAVQIDMAKITNNPAIQARYHVPLDIPIYTPEAPLPNVYNEITGKLSNRTKKEKVSSIH